MKKYTSPINTIRHIMLEYGGGVVPATRKREGGEVKPVNKATEKKKKVENTGMMAKESFESRVDRIRGIVEDLGKMERRIQAGDRREGDEARIKHMYDKQVRVQREKGDLPAELQKERPSRDVEGRMEAKTRLKNMKPTPKGETRYYRETGEQVHTPSMHDHIEAHGGIPLTKANVEKHGLVHDEVLEDDKAYFDIMATKGPLKGHMLQPHSFSHEGGETTHGLFSTRHMDIGKTPYTPHHSYEGRRVNERDIIHHIPEGPRPSY